MIDGTQPKRVLIRKEDFELKEYSNLTQEDSKTQLREIQCLLIDNNTFFKLSQPRTEPS